ncbi:hypothetical protein RhiirA5_368056, partial [Rhizophagus irregularis]
MSGILPIPGCFTITRMCFLGGFDDKKQERRTLENTYIGKVPKIFFIMIVALSIGFYY